MPKQAALEDTLDYPHVVKLPGLNISRKIIRIFPNTNPGYPLGWKEVDSATPCADSLIVAGDLAERMLEFLDVGILGAAESSAYLEGSNCHGAALYVTGVADEIIWVNARMIHPFYQHKNGKLRYYDQSPPVIVHFMTRGFDIKKGPSFDGYAHHSAVILGQINGEAVCFEKDSESPARIMFLRNVEKEWMRRYGIEDLFFVKPC